MPASTPGGDSVLARLLADGIVQRQDSRYRTTRRWQAAMARAALHLQRMGDPGTDLRTPMIHVLLEFYGNNIDDDELASLVHVLLPIEVNELSPPPPT